jgi:hypothetical protein
MPAISSNRSRKIRITIVAADSLIKRDILRLPDPFAIVSVDGEQIHTTSVIKRTLNPYWNENFDITVKDSSVVAVQIFDQRKFKRKQDQGFLGVINIKVSDVLDLELGGQGESISGLARSGGNCSVQLPGTLAPCPSGLEFLRWRGTTEAPFNPSHSALFSALSQSGADDAQKCSRATSKRARRMLLSTESSSSTFPLRPTSP